MGLFAEGVAVKRIGDETFRLCQEYLDDIITVDSDAICAAMKDLFEDVRAVAEPSGALALAGMKKGGRGGASLFINTAALDLSVKLNYVIIKLRNYNNWEDL